jgi:hypothetical protein
VKQAKPRPTKQARLVVDADAAAEPHPVLPQPLRLVSRRALGPSRHLSLLTTWRTRMRSTISSQSELCLSRLVFPLRVIVFMFIRVYLGCARCLRAMTRKAARKPRSSHPCFAHFFWFQDAVFCVMNRPSLPLYDFLVGWTLILFYYTYYVGVFYFILVMTHRWNHVRFFPFFFSFFQSHSRHPVSPTYPLIYLARAD